MILLSTSLQWTFFSTDSRYAHFFVLPFYFSTLTGKPNLLLHMHLLNIDWHSFLFGSEDASFLPEVLIRSVLMFTVILFGLRILGKRSVTQLSVFELGVIIGLGSAAGDPMFYKDVGLLPGMLVFLVIISMYRLVTFLINHSDRVEKVLEGVPVYLVRDGKLVHEDFKKELLAHDEFFAELRGQHISHLGQLELALIETNGAISVYFFEDDKVKWGLPVLPDLFDEKLLSLPAPGTYACRTCGQVVETKEPTPVLVCPVCDKQEWVKALNGLRVT